MKSIGHVLTRGVVTALTVALFGILFSETGYCQRNNNCNVQQNTQQTSAAAAIERAQVNEIVRQQSQQPQPQRFVQSSSASASAAPSVAGLRAQGSPQYLVQGLPGGGGGASSAASAGGASAASSSAPVDPNSVTVSSLGNGGSGGSGSRFHRPHLLARLMPQKTQTTKSVAITRVTTPR